VLASRVDAVFWRGGGLGVAVAGRRGAHVGSLREGWAEVEGAGGIGAVGPAARPALRRRMLLVDRLRGTKRGRPTMLLDELASGPWSANWHERVKAALDEALGGGAGRFGAAAGKVVAVRAPLLQVDDAPFAALIHPSNPTSGGYSGMSYVLFPAAGAPPMVAMVVGTQGLGDDASILSRPGHIRRLAAFTRWLNDRYGGGSQIAWTKSDPTRIDQDIPSALKTRFESHRSALARYGKVIYSFCVAPAGNAEALRTAAVGFLDIAMQERDIRPLTHFKADSERIRSGYGTTMMPNLSAADIVELLRRRRFAVVEGPPGTGKTRLALELLNTHYAGRGTSIQFHPGTTYESFVGGLAPVAANGPAGLQFEPRPGHLMQAAAAARVCAPDPFLLHIDEINRADLSKVLGEAIYLLEPSPERERRVALAYEFEGVSPSEGFSLPHNLHVLGTMNSADRSIAILDVAVRRRFAFAKLWPQGGVIEAAAPTMREAFDRLFTIFVDWASDEAFGLMPGHSYFMEVEETLAAQSLRLNLVPLLEEYLAQGYLPGFAEEIRAYCQWIESL
jgi:5-methylcytosine-specific restriction enzyme B